ncbi:MAG TPA: ABC transporter substrate-binding protein [Rhizomicrobium sp.]|nr:ABC transporter substrate-binding protein [Rhizomicrobium sp.]
MGVFFRRFALAILAAGLPVFAGAAAAATPAETFVQDSVDRGVQVLTDKSLSPAEKKAKVEELLGTIMNTRKLALFCLGNVAKTADPAEVDAFADAFAKFTMAKYSSQLGDYGGQSLKVTGSTDRSPTDHVVTAVLVDPAVPEDPDPVKVLFRVLDDGGKFGVVDASIAGVWFGMAQRDDIQGFLSTNNNDVKKLTERMNEMTAKLKAGA